MGGAKKDSRDAIVTMISKELAKDPRVSNEQLRRNAIAIDRGIARLGRRQFFAGYVLGAKRVRNASQGGRRAEAPVRARRAKARSNGARGRAHGNGAQAGVPRDRVRSILLDLTAKAAEASERPALIALFTTIDDYVDRVIEAV
jgi:hypothetical protein